MPESFEDQSELIWRHLGAIMASAGMGIGNLVPSNLSSQSGVHGSEKGHSQETSGRPRGGTHGSRRDSAKAGMEAGG